MRKSIEKFLDFLVYSNIYLAFGATCFAYTAFLFFEATPDLYILLIVFLLTFSMYNINRLTDIKEDTINVPKRAHLINKYKKILIYLIPMLLFVSIIISFYKNVLDIIFIIFILSLLYSVKWIPKKISKRYRRFKDILLVKNIVISITWSVATVLIVSKYLDLFNYVVLFFSIFVFLKLVINTIFFDMRDIKGDKKSGIKTIPMVFGINKTKILLHGLNITSGLFILSSIFLELIPNLAYFLFLSTFYTFTYVYLFNRYSKNRYLFEVIADGEFIMIGLLGLSGSILI
jgi:4-hydroxybenzoate polyprenyltransferase